MTEWAACWTPDTWRDYLGVTDEAQTDCSLIRDRTFIGRPLGSEQFVQYLEELTGRRLQFGPVGRPKLNKVYPFADMEESGNAMRDMSYCPLLLETKHDKSMITFKVLDRFHV